MNTHTTRPKWWQVYLTLPFLIALFILDSRLKFSIREHQVVQIGIIVLVYGLVHLWLKANETALSNSRQFRGSVTIINLSPYKLANTPNDKVPMFQLPDHEIKNILSDTFEMDYIDAELLPDDEVPQELNKE
jgi:hypothetical protein